MRRAPSVRGVDVSARRRRRDARALSRAMLSKRARGARDAAPTSASKIQIISRAGTVARARHARARRRRRGGARETRGTSRASAVALAVTHDRVRTLEVGLRVETTRRRRGDERRGGCPV